jgi:dolichol-phosphate mannosyltransferase
MTHTGFEDPSRRKALAIVLPAYNEERNLGPLLDSIRDAMAEAAVPYRVIVVDDGSVDQTAEAVASRESSMPLLLVRHPRNQGLGPTIRDGLRLATELAGDGDVIVTMDADQSHNPGLIPRLLQAIHEGHDVVIASRYRPGSRVCGLPAARILVSLGASWTFRILFPTAGVRDFTCGYRAYRAALLKTALATYGDRFIEAEGFHSMAEILLKLRRLHPIFGEVPFILRYDLKEGATKMRVGRTIRQTLALVLRSRLSAR